MPKPITRITPGKRRRRALGMGMSPELADSVNFWANWVLVGALIVGVLSTYAIVVSGNIKETALKRQLATSKEDFERYKLKSEKDIVESKARQREAELK